MKHLLITILLLFSTCCLSQKKELIYLWPGKVPGEMKEKQPPVIDTARRDDVLRYAEVTDPSIEAWPADPKLNNGAAVIVCPGGGYRILAWDKEGTEIAAWLNGLGYSAFVLQYRIPDKKEGALQDAQRALRVVKQSALKYKIDPDKVGIMGFSAGGSLSARTSILFTKKTYPTVDAADSLPCRPAFAMLIYPAYLDQGENRSLTPELQLTQETPPIFIFQTADDTYGNSALVITTALRDAKLPVELHYLATGGHGYGLRPVNLAAITWPQLAETWLKNIFFPKK